jgi:hypothetical protein
MAAAPLGLLALGLLALGLLEALGFSIRRSVETALGGVLATPPGADRAGDSLAVVPNARKTLVPTS